MISSELRQFELSDEQRAVGELAAEIAQREIAPFVAQWDREHVFPRHLYGKLTDAGLMGILVPESYGGAGADYLSYALAIEELARVVLVEQPQPVVQPGRESDHLPQPGQRRLGRGGVVPLREGAPVVVRDQPT